MIHLGLIRETKNPPDNRVAFTPGQCRWILDNIPGISFTVQSSSDRCYSDNEYASAGIPIRETLDHCDVIFGIKEIDPGMLIPDKTYLFFSHTKKKQLYNQELFRTILRKHITLIDYECMEHEDGQRILGFGFFAGIVGAHNGIMAYGQRTGSFSLGRVYKQKNFRELIHTYFGLKIPNIKIAVTGSGRVAHGILEVMSLLEIFEVEPTEYLAREFPYPVFTQLKGADLYRPLSGSKYNRDDFHEDPSRYTSLFLPYARQSDILMNGIYWDENVPRLFESSQIADSDFRICTIADITDDKNGSVPINLGDTSIYDPIYGVDRQSLQKTAPYLSNSIDVMAVGNLPNELPRDASRFFGEQLLKHIFADLIGEGSPIIERATIVRKGEITPAFEYLREYGGL